MKHRLAQLLIQAARRLDPSLRPPVDAGDVNRYSREALAYARAAQDVVDAQRRIAKASLR